jgi:hypothetical protein
MTSPLGGVSRYCRGLGWSLAGPRRLASNPKLGADVEKLVGPLLVVVECCGQPLVTAIYKRGYRCAA